MRFRIEIDYESDEEWSVGALPKIPVEPGDPVRGRDLCDVLDRIAKLYREEFGDREEGPCVGYPGREN